MRYLKIPDIAYRAIAFVRNMFIQNNSVLNDAALISSHRITYVALIMIPVNLAHIIIFYAMQTDSQTEATWRSGIILAHFILMSVMLLAGSVNFIFKKKQQPRPVLAVLIQYLLALVILGFGVAITVIDQLVTPSITPFLVACTVVSLIILMRPLISIPLFFTAYLAFYFTLETTQTDPSILVSNRGNGIVVAGIGICLSIIIWQSAARNILQRRQIEAQRNELVKINKNLKFLASHDELTGLINRSEFIRLVDLEQSRMRRYRYDSCLLIADIDHFKQINDQFGHPAGDVIITALASFLKAHLREIDLIARWGGEEFIMLLPNTGLDQGMAAAERIRKGVGESQFQVQGRLIQIKISFGGAALCHAEQDTFQESYELADAALYQAKAQGRNQVAATEKKQKSAIEPRQA